MHALAASLYPGERSPDKNGRIYRQWGSSVSGGEVGVRRGWALASGGLYSSCRPYSVPKNDRAAAGQKLELFLTDEH